MTLVRAICLYAFLFLSWTLQASGGFVFDASFLRPQELSVENRLQLNAAFPIFKASLDPSREAPEQAVTCDSLQNKYKKFYPNQTLSFKSNGKFEFLIPNETDPIKLLPHLIHPDNKYSGRLFVAGTERGWTILALCERCTGLIGVDINPRVKAYNDFNLLLFTLSADRQDYLKLRAVEEIVQAHKNRYPPGFVVRKYHIPNDLAEEGAALDYFPDLITEIKERLERSGLDEDMKKYYRRNFDAMAEIFFSIQLQGRELIFIDKDFGAGNNGGPYFKEANYLFDDTLFNNIKAFASRGEIIFTTGSIIDFQEFQDEEFLTIDISNIPDYHEVRLAYSEIPQIVNQNVRVIWTRTFDMTKY